MVVLGKYVIIFIRIVWFILYTRMVSGVQLNSTGPKNGWNIWQLVFPSSFQRQVFVCDSDAAWLFCKLEMLEILFQVYWFLPISLSRFVLFYLARSKCAPAKQMWLMQPGKWIFHQKALTHGLQIYSVRPGQKSTFLIARHNNLFTCDKERKYFFALDRARWYISLKSNELELISIPRYFCCSVFEFKQICKFM